MPGNSETVGASNFAVWNHDWSTHWTIGASLSYIPDTFRYNNNGIRFAEVGGDSADQIITGSNAIAVWDSIIGSAWWIMYKPHTRLAVM